MYTCAMTRWYVCWNSSTGTERRYDDTVVRATWLVDTCAVTHLQVQSAGVMTQLCVWRGSLICVPWRRHTRDMTRWHVCYDSLICVPWLVDMCAMAHPHDITRWYVCHNAGIHVTWLVDMCAMTRWYVCYDSLICVLWLVGMCVMTHPQVLSTGMMT